MFSQAELRGATEMTDSNTGMNKRLSLNRLSAIRKIAVLILDGPRSLMFPNDPEGEQSWLEPVARLSTHTSPQISFDSVAIYCVPNVLTRAPNDPLVLRHCSWNMAADRTRCAEGAIAWPTIQTVFRQVPASKVIPIDDLLRELDTSLPSFPFPIEGLDLAGSSGFRPLPPDATIVQDSVDRHITRITRYHHLKLNWTATSKTSQIDAAWEALYGALTNVIDASPSVEHLNMLERYDISPEKYASLVLA